MLLYLFKIPLFVWRVLNGTTFDHFTDDNVHGTWFRIATRRLEFLVGSDRLAGPDWLVSNWSLCCGGYWPMWVWPSIYGWLCWSSNSMIKDVSILGGIRILHVVWSELASLFLSCLLLLLLYFSFHLNRYGDGGN